MQLYFRLIERVFFYYHVSCYICPFGPVQCGRHITPPARSGLAADVLKINRGLPKIRFT